MNKQNTPLLTTFNNEIEGVVRWCTPSIHLGMPRVRGIYENDISVSYHKLGNPANNTGIFKTAHNLASQAYGSDHTLFSVNGSTGSNFTVLRALKNQLKHVNLLAQRNVHKSITVACEDYSIDVSYIEPRYDNELQIFVPNTIEEIEQRINEVKPNVLLITNPTYEGLSINLVELIEKVHSIDSEIIIFIDEAWGAHFSFSSKLPISAMQAGADICVQSTHKQGSSLQQSAMIHWNEGRISQECLMDSYKSLITTSPSYHLLASLDAARFFMENYGSFEMERLIQRAELFREKLNRISGIFAYSPMEIKKRYGKTHNLEIDATKILINLENISGIELAKLLEDEFRIVVEKYEAENILLIMTLQNDLLEINQTVDAISAILLKNKFDDKRLKFPIFPTKIIKKSPAFAVNKSQRINSISLENSIGKVCAENIVPYPPGIPLITKGEVIQNKHINYLKALKKANGLITVLMNDESIETIKAIE